MAVAKPKRENQELMSGEAPVRTHGSWLDPYQVANKSSAHRLQMHRPANKDVM